MKSSPYDWDMLVEVDGKECLLSELAPIIPCPHCQETFAVGDFRRHLVDKHGWKELYGSTK